MIIIIIGAILVLVVFLFLKYNKDNKPKEKVKPFDWDAYYSSKIPPANLDNILLPPWQKFDYNRFDLGWRMGSGEDYIGLWWYWFDKLSEKDKFDYQKKFPEPENGNWIGFYKDEFSNDEE